MKTKRVFYCERPAVKAMCTMPVSSASKAPSPLTRKISRLTYDFHVYVGETA